MTKTTQHAEDCIVLCPRCEKRFYLPYGMPKEVTEEAYANGWQLPALSRADNKTDICSPCGTVEALDDFTGRPLRQPESWPVRDTQ